MKTFYGANALKSAHNAAKDGDVVTLSGGAFNAVDVTKRITIRGAGMGVKVQETDTYTDPTIILGNFKVTADGNSTHHFTMEGIRHEECLELRGIRSSQFIKCQFGEIKFTPDYGALGNVTFVHCYISKRFLGHYNVTLTGVNCYFKNADFDGNESTYTLTNCVIETSVDNRINNLRKAALKNCIIVNSSGVSYTKNASIYYTMWFGFGENPFPNASVDHNNYWNIPLESLFKEGTFYRLVDEAKVYKGSDGTELGIYGGQLPFDPTPSNPQITKFNVAPKTTADGKLSVDIEVK